MKLTALGIVLSMLFLPLTAVSQVSITTNPGTYTQNFDGAFLGGGNYTLTDNAATNLGWYSFATLTPSSSNVFTASIGNSLTGQFYNYGLAGDTNRALGSIASAATNGNMFYGLRLQNDTVLTFQSVRVQYAGEQWLDFFPAPQTLTFSYQTSAGNITSLTAGTFISEPSLNYSTASNVFAGPLNGNAAPNHTAIDSTFIVTIPPGSEIMLRWEDTADALVFNHGIAIDDVTITLTTLGPTAAPVSISGRVTTANGAGIAGAVLVLSGGQLEQPITTRTNSFGYYQINAPAGATYLLDINSKRYTFSQSSQVIHAQDNVAGVNFIAE